MSKDKLSLWDKEYKRGGIPSSVRDEPSGVLLWALSCWPYVTGTNVPISALDVGCGTGRNAVHLATLGTNVSAFDSSREAIERANARLQTLPTDVRTRIHFEQRGLEDGLPVGDRSLDLVTDIFVYKHQMAESVRKTYREELRRALKGAGVLLLSLAHKDDGYYSKCPQYGGQGRGYQILDPVAGVGSVLFDLSDLVEEFADTFVLEIAWQKQKRGTMHGSEYNRVTLVTLWRPK